MTDASGDAAPKTAVLSPDDAAQYWLVTEGLEEAPEDWVVPVDGWF